jgi:hypothetical protein
VSRRARGTAPFLPEHVWGAGHVWCESRYHAIILSYHIRVANIRKMKQMAQFCSNLLRRSICSTMEAA